MTIVIVYLIICLFIFGLLLSKEFKQYKSGYNSFNEDFWVAAFCLACPVVNLLFLLLLIIEYCRYN